MWSCDGNYWIERNGNDRQAYSIYFPILDSMLSELNHRFAEKNLEHMRANQAYSPQSPNFLERSNVHTLEDSYGLDMDSLSVECSLAVLLMFSVNVRIAFPFLNKLLQIALTILVSTAHCERSLNGSKLTCT